jgi:rhodanese-related sulfurtransferase
MGRSVWAIPASGDDPLRDMATDTAHRHPDIEHMQPAALALKLVVAPEKIILFDVREPREFAVSHLAHAISVPPRRASALKLVQETLARRPEVEWALFYCAVGVRSSTLASQLGPASSNRNVRAGNLVGGVFRWANEGRPLVNAEGATAAVHPFNRHWGRFLVPQSPQN